MGMGNEELAERLESLEQLVGDLCDVITSFRAKQKRTRQKSLLDLGAVDNKSDFVELRDALVATFARVTGRDYVFDGAKDASAVKKLLTLRADLRAKPLQDRWEECLRKKGFPGTQSLAQFAGRINSFGAKADVVVALPIASGDPYAR